MNHAQLARLNEAAARTALVSVEWRATMAFYAALHGASHALSPTSPSKLSTHDARRRALVRVRPDLVACYDALQGLSELARYVPASHPIPHEDLATALRDLHDFLASLCVPYFSPPQPAGPVAPVGGGAAPAPGRRLRSKPVR